MPLSTCVGCVTPHSFDPSPTAGNATVTAITGGIIYVDGSYADGTLMYTSVDIGGQVLQNMTVLGVTSMDSSTNSNYDGLVGLTIDATSTGS